jgi:CHAT domain-containing protein
MLKDVPADQVATRDVRAATMVEESIATAEETDAKTTHPYFWSAFMLMGNWL